MYSYTRRPTPAIQSRSLNGNHAVEHVIRQIPVNVRLILYAVIQLQLLISSNPDQKHDGATQAAVAGQVHPWLYAKGVTY